MALHVRPRFRPVRIFHGWWVLGSGFLVQGANNILLTQGFGAYLVQLQGEFGWSKTALSGAFSLLQVVSGVLGPVQGKLIDRFGARAVIQAGLVILAAGCLLLSLISTLFTFYAVFLIMAIGYTLSNWVSVSVLAANWFERRRGMAMGTITAAATVPGFFVPLLAMALNRYGWRTTTIAAAFIVLLVCIPATLIMRNRPEDCGMTPDGDPVRPPRTGDNARAAQDDSQDFTVAEAMRTSSFWLLGVGHATALLLVFAVNVHLIAHLVERLRMSVEMASMMLALMTAFAVVGQIVGGVLGDRLEKRLLVAVGMLGHMLGVLALAFATNILWVVAFAVLHGTAWGVRGPLASAIRADYYGKKHLGSILGYSMLMLMLGTLGGPLLGGFLADLTGDYRLAFVIIGVLGAFGGLAFLFARKPTKPGLPAPTLAA